MKSKYLRRAIASASVLTIAAGLTAAIGMSTATAAPEGTSEVKAAAPLLTIDAASVTPEAPTLTATPVSVTVGQAVAVTATTEGGNTLVITADGLEIYNDVSATGTETVTYTATTAGTSIVTATAGNSVGTSPATTTSVTVNVAPTLPAAPTNLELSPSIIQVQARTTITGKAEPNSRVWVKYGINNNLLDVDGQGNFSASLYGGNVVGQFEVTVYAVNAAGNGPTASAGILFVNARSGVPYWPILTVAPSSITVGETVAVTATTQAGNTLVIAADGHDIYNGATATGTETVNYTPAAAGTVKVSARASNGAGTSGWEWTNVTVTAAPTVPAKPTHLTATPNPATVGEVITLSGKAEALSTVDVSAGLQSCDATSSAAGDFSCQLTAANEGQLTITAVASNGLGAGAPSDPISVQVTPRPVAPSAPEVTLSASSVKVGEPVTATITTTPGAEVAITIDGATTTIDADGAGNATHTFTPTAAGTVTVSVTASTTAGSSTPTVTSVEVAALPPGEATISVNPSAPVAGDTVELTVTNADAGTTVTIKNGNVVVCSVAASADGAVHCEWHPDQGAYDLTITATVDGVAQSLAKHVVVSAAPIGPVDPELPGTGSLGSLGALFGSPGR